jgi:hypothetical protein
MTTEQDTVLTRPWRKSSYCNTGGQCVEVAQAGATCLIRDSKDPSGPWLAFSAAAWKAFIRDVKNGGYGP